MIQISKHAKNTGQMRFAFQYCTGSMFVHYQCVNLFWSRYFPTKHHHTTQSGIQQ
jgi:hypothetical protein